MKAPGDETEWEDVTGLVCSVLDAIVPQLPSASCPLPKRGRMFEGEEPCPLRPSAYVQVRSPCCRASRAPALHRVAPRGHAVVPPRVPPVTPSLAAAPHRGFSNTPDAVRAISPSQSSIFDDTQPRPARRCASRATISSGCCSLPPCLPQSSWMSRTAPTSRCVAAPPARVAMLPCRLPRSRAARGACSPCTRDPSS